MYVHDVTAAAAAAMLNPAPVNVSLSLSPFIHTRRAETMRPAEDA